MKRIVLSLVWSFEDTFKNFGIRLTGENSEILEEQDMDVADYGEFLQMIDKFIKTNSLNEGSLSKLISLINSNVYDFQYLKYSILRKISMDYEFMKVNPSLVTKTILSWLKVEQNNDDFFVYLCYFPKIINSIFENEMIANDDFQEFIERAKNTTLASFIEYSLCFKDTEAQADNKYEQNFKKFSFCINLCFLKEEISYLYERRKLALWSLSQFSTKTDSENILNNCLRDIKHDYQLHYFIKILIKGSFVLCKPTFERIVIMVKSKPAFDFLYQDESIFKSIYSMKAFDDPIATLRSLYIDFGNMTWFNFILGYELLAIGRYDESFLLLKQVEEMLFVQAINRKIENSNIPKRNQNQSETIILIEEKDRPTKMIIADSIFEKSCKYLSSHYIECDPQFRFYFAEIFVKVCESCSKFGYALNVLDKIKTDDLFISLDLSFRNTLNQNEKLLSLLDLLKNLVSSNLASANSKDPIASIFRGTIKGKVKSRRKFDFLLSRGIF
jgi:hypothetical protein